MGFRTKAFDDMRQLMDFVNENKIKKEDIVNIFQSADKQFILNYVVDEQ